MFGRLKYSKAFCRYHNKKIEYNKEHPTGVSNANSTAYDDAKTSWMEEWNIRVM